MSFLLGFPIFRGYVKLREGSFCEFFFLLALPRSVEVHWLGRSCDPERWTLFFGNNERWVFGTIFFEIGKVWKSEVSSGKLT